MGIMSYLAKIMGTSRSRPGNAPGEAIMVHIDGIGGDAEVELYQAPGVQARPGAGVRGIVVQYGNSSRNAGMIAVQNYEALADLAAGETAIYSTAADGSGPEALIRLRADGTIEINGDSKRLVTWDELNTALTTLCGTLAGHVHPSNGTPSPGLAGLACDIAAAKTTTVKTGG